MLVKSGLFYLQIKLIIILLVNYFQKINNNGLITTGCGDSNEGV
jgi:hypothetical protein